MTPKVKKSLLPDYSKESGLHDNGMGKQPEKRNVVILELWWLREEMTSG